MTKKLQQQHHPKRYPLRKCLGRQYQLQQRRKHSSHPLHNIVILQTPTPSSTMQEVHPTLTIISRYCLGSRSFDIKKKKVPILFDKKDTPTIPHNTGGRSQARKGGLITGLMNKHKRGAHLKTTPTNNKIKGKGETPTKAASTSTDEKRNLQ